MGNRQSITAGKLLFETLIVIIISFIGFVIIQAIALVAAQLYYHGNVQVDSFASIMFEHLNLMKFLQGFSSITLFVLPSIYISNKYGLFLGRFGFQKPNFHALLFVFLIYLFTVPVIGFTSEWNKNIQLPEALSSLETYFKNTEYQAEVLSKEMLKGTHWTVLLVNLLIIAVLPAIGEELFFRGVLQKIFIKMVKNEHIAIFITAFIFSAIHNQFYGLVPRMVLGVVLGYLYVYGKNIWYNVGFHFLNNGVVVVLYFIMNVRHQNVDDLDQKVSGNTWYFSLVALGLLAMTLLYFKRKTAISNSAAQ